MGHTLLFNDLILLRSRAGIATIAEQFLRVFPEIQSEFRVQRLSRLAPFRALPTLRKLYRRLQPEAAVPNEGSSQSKELAGEALRHVAAWGIQPLYRPELFFEPDLLALPLGRRRVATIPDMSVLLFPEWHPLHRVEAYQRHFYETCNRTDAFIAISHCSKADFLKFASLPEDKVRVAPLAPRPQFVPQSLTEIARVRGLHAEGMPYFLFLGTLEPRKNILGLLNAWDKLDEGFRRGVRLLLVGAWGWNSGPLRSRLGTPGVRWLGSVPDEDLVPLVAGAEALLYPSFYEGFGLPPLEAMACGTPVISSNRGALAEVVGDAAWVIDPDEPRAIADAMKHISKESAAWKKRGLAHAKRFSWTTFATTALEVFRSLL